MLKIMFLAVLLQTPTSEPTVAVQTTPHTAECQLCGEFTNMAVRDAQAEYRRLSKKDLLTEQEVRRLVALSTALGTLPEPQNLNECGDTPARCETMRGVRRPINGPVSQH